jgi:hypothetical protein
MTVVVLNESKLFELKSRNSSSNRKSDGSIVLFDGKYWSKWKD